MRHKLCRSFHPWCPGVKTRCLSIVVWEFPFRKQHCAMPVLLFRRLCLYVHVHVLPISSNRGITMWGKSNTNDGSLTKYSISSYNLRKDFDFLSSPCQNGWHFAGGISKSNFLAEHFRILIEISPRLVPTNNNSVTVISSGGGLAMNKRQVIIWPQHMAIKLSHVIRSQWVNAYLIDML